MARRPLPARHDRPDVVAGTVTTLELFFDLVFAPRVDADRARRVRTRGPAERVVLLVGSLGILLAGRGA